MNKKIVSSALTLAALAALPAQALANDALKSSCDVLVSNARAFAGEQTASLMSDLQLPVITKNEGYYNGYSANPRALSSLFSNLKAALPKDTVQRGKDVIELRKQAQDLKSDLEDARKYLAWADDALNKYSYEAQSKQFKHKKGYFGPNGDYGNELKRIRDERASTVKDEEKELADINSLLRAAEGELKNRVATAEGGMNAEKEEDLSLRKADAAFLEDDLLHYTICSKPIDLGGEDRRSYSVCGHMNVLTGDTEYMLSLRSPREYTHNSYEDVALISYTDPSNELIAKSIRGRVYEALEARRIGTTPQICRDQLAAAATEKARKEAEARDPKDAPTVTWGTPEMYKNEGKTKLD